MLIKDYMTRHPLMIAPDTPVTEAQRIMVENRIRHLPVVGDGKRLLGLITRAGLRIAPAALGSLNLWDITRYLGSLTVKDLMVKGEELVTIGSDVTLEEAAQLMIKNKIGCLPVIEDGIVAGIITELDMLRRLSSLLGGDATGVRVTIRVPDRVGEFSKVTNAIAKQGWGIYASGSLPTPKQPGFWDVVVKIRHVSPGELLSVLEQIEGQRIVDVREVP